MQLTEAMIRDKAYMLWEANGRPQGAAEEHWFAAEALLLEATAITFNRADENLERLPPMGLRQLSNP